MKQILLSFRVFDTVVKKYLTPDSKVFIGLDGKPVTPEGPDTANRYEVAYSLPFFDINGKQLFTDDGFITIVDREPQYGRPIFNSDQNYWGFMATSDNVYRLQSKTFQILPNAEEIAAGNLGLEIQAEWEKKAAELPAPDPNKDENAQVFTRTREFAFGCIKVLLTLQSETDMPEDVWNEHFTAVLPSGEIFQLKKGGEEAPAPEQSDAVVTKEYKATILKAQGSSRAPMAWWKIPAIRDAKPKQNNCEHSLQIVDGTKNIVAWEIGRGGTWAQASEFFLVEEVKPEEIDESSNA